LESSGGAVNDIVLGVDMSMKLLEPRAFLATRTVVEVLKHRIGLETILEASMAAKQLLTVLPACCVNLSNMPTTADFTVQNKLIEMGWLLEALEWISFSWDLTETGCALWLKNERDLLYVQSLLATT